MKTPRTARTLGRLTLLATVVAALGGLLMPAQVTAHPLGNFTINRYHGLTIGQQRAQVDRVVDMAEIPALQARHDIDANADGAVSNGEGAGWGTATCGSAADELTLTLDGARAPLSLVGLGLTFPAGQAGLATLRLVCTYEASYAPLASQTSVTFSDASYAGRVGWQEIVAVGDGLTLTGAEEFAAGSSNRLRTYPETATQATRVQSRTEFIVSVGGSAVSQALPADAVPVGSPVEMIMSDELAPTSRTGAVDLPPEITAIFQAQDLTLPAILLSLGVALIIGAVHAASPGHGKTLMAAYLVGTRGTVRHAMGLGLTVTISHTIGVLALGAVVLLAGAVVPSERLFPLLGLIGGIVVTALGVAMLAQRLRMRRAASVVATAHAHDHGHGHDHEHDHGHTHAHQEPASEGWHSHGLTRHTHLPTEDNPLRRRNLVALGLVGGLVPSASAILILVGSIAAGRPAFGILLTIAFGLGMAAVLVGVGILLVRARGLVERLPSATRLTPVFAKLPLLTAVVFLIVGSAMTVQAGTQLR